MAISKFKNSVKDKVEVSLSAPACVGYADCVLHTPVSVRIKNGSSENLELKVVLHDGKGLLVPYETVCSVPFESAVELSAEGIFSPLFLVENGEPSQVEAEVSVFSDGKEIACAKQTVTALPFDVWEGLSGNPERLAAYVRPRLQECSRTLEEAGARMRKWGSSSEMYGYAASGKSTVRMAAAAVFAAIKNDNFERLDCDLSQPVCVFAKEMFKERRANPLQLALFAAACLEEARLHAVLAVGKRGVGVGLWLYDSCFLDTVTDDKEIVGKYLSEGINNLCFFDVDDAFAGKSVNFTTSERHFKEKLEENYYEYFVDVRRCRVAGIPVLPIKEKGLKGTELVKDADMSADSAPAPLRELKKAAVEGKLPKNKIWERRLLDLSSRNPLLDFRGKDALRVRADDGDALYRRLCASEGMKLKSGGGTGEFTEAERQLLALEQEKDLLAVCANEAELAETARLLQRKNREADEETGAKILYLSCGFLQYVSKEDGKRKLAPLVLCPVDIGRAKGNEDFRLASAEGEYFVNSTLLEFLKEEYNIDVRGLGGDISALKMSEIFAMVAAETASMKGWTVVKDIYVAAFSFRRYLMWNDLHAHFEELKSNKIVSALLNGRMERAPLPEVKEEDDGDPAGTLIPLPADSSQYSAVALSRTGTSFVLHGPPGTGKSQTITNIIANALQDGKRVLFVAEKKAALDVVKKRLDAVGVGEFCLELHAGKADKNEAVKRLEETLALSGAQNAEEFSRLAEEVKLLREELKEPMRALHKKRRLGLSVYQAILLYLKNKDAPDVMDIESSFYDTLGERKLADCKNRILSAAAAAKECGGVFNSPFENVNLTQYSQELRDKLFCASEVLLAEIKHLKGFLGLFLEFYRQKLSVITRQKLENVRAIARNFLSGTYDKYFTGVTEEQFYVFFNANRRLDERVAFYNKHFKSAVELGKDLPEIRDLLEKGENYRRSKAACSAAKKLSRAALHPLTEEDTVKFLQTLVDINDAMERIKSVPLAKNFTDRGGGFAFKKRAEYLAALYELHALCAATFFDFNPDSFNGMCYRARSGYTRPVLEGYLKAYEAFSLALESFLQVTNASRASLPQEDVLDYFSAKAGALIDNVDLLPNWCMYRRTTEKLKELGCNFVTEALENGKLTWENVLSGFEKNVYKNFLEINIPADPELSRMTVGSLEDSVEKFRAAWEEFSRATRKKLRYDLISRLPREEDGSLSLEVASFRRLVKSNLRGAGLRGLFAQIPELLGRIAPCMLMSPTTVAQFLKPEADLYDLVIFDEASQMTTAEAIGSIARAKAAIVVGDPRQLPPTTFFRTGYVDEENLENEDLESVLDDCLALGMSERHLKWHYRSKHESLIAFSNGMYYGNKLCTFPSPDADSKVRLIQVDGSYDRGFTKCNRKEAEELTEEVIRRLKDPAARRSSMGVVTFSSAQQNLVERLLSKAILKEGLEGAAYDREEPLFVKNLENVQGDERDVILFSVCYGPDPSGRVSLNFGPLNQAGGWRRLNVALSRAREEMLVFSSMTSGMIDLSKTSSKGVAGLKAFLEFAQKGRMTLAVKSEAVTEGTGVGKYLAKELAGYGYDCRVDVGASDFKIDVAVLDPKNPHEFILAILFDGSAQFSVKDRNILQIQTLKRTNWNVARVNCVNYYNNPKREIKRLKDLLDKLTGAETKKGSSLSRCFKPYRSVKAEGAETAAFVTGGENDGAIMSRLREIVAVEEPISRAFLKTRCLASFGIQKAGTRMSAKLDALIDGCALRKERVNGTDYFYKTDRAVQIGKFRTEETPVLRKGEEDFTPFELVSLVKALLEERVSVYFDELVPLLAAYCKVRATERFSGFVRDCIAYGEQKGVLVRSVSDRVSLA